jgi:hypothetical protein
MSDPTTSATATGFVPSGHPVRRFVAGLAAVAAVFVALWWTGLVAPRLELSVDDRFDPGARQGEAVVTVRNQAPLPATVEPPELRDRWGGSSAEEIVVRQTGVTPDHEMRVEGGSVATFTVRFTVDCDRYHRAVNTVSGATDPALELRLRAQGPLGGDRRALSYTNLARACGLPVEGE